MEGQDGALRVTYPHPTCSDVDNLATQFLGAVVNFSGVNALDGPMQNPSLRGIAIMAAKRKAKKKAKKKKKKK